jgi:cytochrome c-type biogenesis protein CcmH/NrfG
VARDSSDHPALLELGHLYLRQQRLNRAATVSMRAVELRPQARETAEAFAHLGMILWNAGETDVGLQALEQALFLHPDLPEALLYKGIVLFAGKQDPRGAAAAWERYLAVAPADAETGRVRSMLEAARQSIR